MKILSECSLKNNLTLLKTIVSELNINNLNNIYFINTVAFYDYLDKINNYNYNTLNIVKILEKYIPICSYEDTETLHLLKLGASSLNLAEISYIKNLLYKKSIINFLFLLSKTNNEKDFSIIFNACNNIRKTLQSKY